MESWGLFHLANAFNVRMTCDTSNKVTCNHIKHGLTYLDHKSILHFSNLAPESSFNYTFKRFTKVSSQTPPIEKLLRLFLLISWKFEAIQNFHIDCACKHRNKATDRRPE